MSKPCPACGSGETTAFFEAPSVPVFCNVLWETAEDARGAARGTIRLHACGNCRLVFNAVFDPDLLAYSPRYENSLHSSARFQEFAESLGRNLVDRFGLHDEVILEVGCGRAEFLALLCRLGGNRGVGFDQSYDPSEPLPDAGTGSLQITQAPFPASTEGLTPALTLSRHVLEHIQEPLPFAEAMVAVAGRRHGGGVYVEVPNVLYTLRDLGIWDVIYEHCNYFSAEALSLLLGAAGARVTRTYAAYGDQFLCSEAVVDGAPNADVAPMEGWDTMVADFSHHQREKVGEWADRLQEYRERGERLALWGAGSKGVMFLNLVPGTDVIADVVDLNPRKHGCYTAGTGHRIVSPADLVETPPSTVLVMNPLYVSEIRERLDELGIPASIELV